MPPSIDTVQSWQGRTMVDPAGDKLGTIDTMTPATGRSSVPAAPATLSAWPMPT